MSVVLTWRSTPRLVDGTDPVAGASVETAKPRRRIVFHQRRLAAEDSSQLFCLSPTLPDSIPSPTGFDNLGPEADEVPNSSMSSLSTHAALESY